MSYCISRHGAEGYSPATPCRSLCCHLHTCVFFSHFPTPRCPHLLPFHVTCATSCTSPCCSPQPDPLFRASPPPPPRSRRRAEVRVRCWCLCAPLDAPFTAHTKETGRKDSRLSLCPPPPVTSRFDEAVPTPSAVTSSRFYVRSLCARVCVPGVLVDADAPFSVRVLLFAFFPFSSFAPSPSFTRRRASPHCTRSPLKNFAPSVVYFTRFSAFA